MNELLSDYLLARADFLLVVDALELVAHGLLQQALHRLFGVTLLGVELRDLEQLRLLVLASLHHEVLNEVSVLQAVAHQLAIAYLVAVDLIVDFVATS